MHHQADKATFAGGCFWGVEETFRQTPGVTFTRVGYMGGETANPTYEQVCAAITGHAEVVEVSFNSSLINYAALLDIFLKKQSGRSCDISVSQNTWQYRSVIYYHNKSQRLVAEKKLAQLTQTRQFPNAVNTKLLAADTFWQAEEYHQQYVAKNK